MVGCIEDFKSYMKSSVESGETEPVLFGFVGWGAGGAVSFLAKDEKVFAPVYLAVNAIVIGLGIILVYHTISYMFTSNLRVMLDTRSLGWKASMKAILKKEGLASIGWTSVIVSLAAIGGSVFFLANRKVVEQNLRQRLPS